MLDLLFCQEYAAKRIRFEAATDVGQYSALSVPTENVAIILEDTKRDVKLCRARPFIYGGLPILMNDGQCFDSLFTLIQNFQQHSDKLERTQLSISNKEAPLHQCALLSKAFEKRLIAYKTPLVPLDCFGPLLELVQPLQASEAANLNSYMRALLPHQAASHMPIERFYAFASAVESIACRRGTEVGEPAREIIYGMITYYRDELWDELTRLKEDQQPLPDRKNARHIPRSGLREKFTDTKEWKVFFEKCQKGGYISPDE